MERNQAIAAEMAGTDCPASVVAKFMQQGDTLEGSHEWHWPDAANVRMLWQDAIAVLLAAAGTALLTLPLYWHIIQ